MCECSTASRVSHLCSSKPLSLPTSVLRAHAGDHKWDDFKDIDVPRNPTHLDGAGDMSNLIHLETPHVLHNLVRACGCAPVVCECVCAWRSV